MNFAKKLSLIALSAVLFASCNDKSKDGNVEGTEKDSTAVDSINKETAANLETTSFKIDGMTCPTGCAAMIEKKLAGLDGVGEAKVDFEKKTATVSFDAAKQTPEKLVETVEGLADGAYKVSEVKSSGDKAYFSVEQEKEKKKEKTAKKEKKSKKGGDSKAGCGTEKKGGCCSESAKKSCGGHA
ncbi:cation transporter [Flavobacterium sp. MFBS3-15]|uniref:heavy-metal-associated domain-containing protein n=1 Tax=Flavobacterium sp. MFBS3-15 TaxID=2989816 RepID=UPI0022361D66|nr:heavy-metal-associated domain-containing protein [Flavobacterium sp. MFBS3-15]MCW4468205.1 cation transporter [Flavobacterium sp. MFBS3-15]